MKTNIYILFTILLLLFSCKKKKIELQTLPANNDPVFVVQGLIDGEQVNYQAGINNVSIATSVINRNGMPYTKGEMNISKDIFSLGVFDGNSDVPNLVNLLNGGDTLFLASKSQVSLALFSRNNCSNADKISTIKWYVDGAFKADNELNMTTPGKYEVCGEFAFKNGSFKTVCNTILIGFQTDVNVTVNHFMLGPGLSRVWVSGADSSKISSVKWKMDGNIIASTLIPTITLPLQQKIISAEILTTAGKTYTRNIVIDGTNMGNYTDDFNHFLFDSTIKWDHAVGLDIFKNGHWFSTFLSDNYKSSAIIDGVDFYEVNSNGENVYKLKGRLDAKLSSTTSSKSIFVKVNFVYPIIFKP